MASAAFFALENATLKMQHSIIYSSQNESKIMFKRRDLCYTKETELCDSSG